MLNKGGPSTRGAQTALPPTSSESRASPRTTAKMTTP